MAHSTGFRPAERLIKQFFSEQKKIIYKKNQQILQGDDQPQGVYYLVEGFVRVYVISENGAELTLNIFTPGSFFPMFWAINHINNAYCFEAMSNIVVYRAPQAEFLTQLKNSPELLEIINQLVLHSLNSTLTRFQYMVLGNATQKVACVLIMLLRRFGKLRSPGRYVIAFPITQQQIAKLAALTRESVSVVLKSLEAEKLLCREKRHYVVLHFQDLLEKSGFYIDDRPLPYLY